MTNVLKQRSFKCFEWTVQSSSYNVLVSDDFPLLDRKCHLELKLGVWDGYSYGCSSLNFVSDGKLQQPVIITIRVPIAPDYVDSQTRKAQEYSITSESQTIWTSYCGLLNKMLTFEITIHTYSLKGEFYFIIFF